ncbi:MAG: ATP-dependent DNA helicase RecG, partial [Armatimonadetes bacterium]|nr:ATP-dependent DNA helicase RecG [Armatimonadota bacterium]
RWVKQALDQLTNEVPEVLPLGVRETWELVGRREAIRSYHFPASEAELRLARRRLVFEEFFGLQVALAQRRHEYDHRGHGIAFKTDSALTAQLHRSLPFELTDAQQRVLQEIRRDLAQPRPMNRLVQGDVGSGKTLVALSAMLTVVDNGYQAALMVPTEILAEQHHRVLRHWCEPLGVSLDLITGRAGSKQRRESQARLSQGETQIAVGTHALIQEGIDFDHLGLVVVDEQHRFGVLQRKLLSGKGETPDVLVMTATPIPRTLALTVYGELDVSVIDELPRGRTPIVTEWYPLGKRRELYSQIKERLRAGRQAYVVCPLVEESEALEDVEAATAMAEHLREHFKGFEVGLIHGRLKPAEKDEVMLRFRAGKIDLLAATTVIEVGIDVPNATIMLIVNADRFGLAQLHQLRGRVGRGAHESQCYLLTDARYNPELAEDESSLQYRDARARMRFLRDYSDGFRLAEADLELRGPGELGGTRQSGSLDFRVANLASDGRLLEDARTAAQKLVKDDPHLALADHAALARFVAARYRDRGQLAEVG